LLRFNSISELVYNGGLPIWRRRGWHIKGSVIDLSFWRNRGFGRIRPSHSLLQVAEQTHEIRPEHQPKKGRDMVRGDGKQLGSKRRGCFRDQNPGQAYALPTVYPRSLSLLLGWLNHLALKRRKRGLKRKRNGAYWGFFESGNVGVSNGEGLRAQFCAMFGGERGGARELPFKKK